MEETSYYQQMLQLLQDLQPEIDKFYQKGNKSAGTRIRKAMQELKSIAQDQRSQISELGKK